MNLTRRQLVGLVALAATGTGAAAAPAPPPPTPAPAANLRALRPGSFAAIEAARRGRPFLLVLWSITCVPCRDEFALLRDMREAHPGLPLVIICTDDIADAAVAARALADFGMAGEESWIFAAESQALRYEIDPGWYGELPRAYFYDASHRREGVSGRLSRIRIEEWLGKPPAAS